MAHWKLTLSYDGTSFHGWQVQPDLRTVQGTLAGALHRITGETVLPQGSGRTDAGVHALAQVASFTLAANIPSNGLLRALNSVLPPSIRITAAEQVSPDFHARHSALRKTYEYRIFERHPSPTQTAGVAHPRPKAGVAHSSRLHRDEWGTTEAASSPLATPKAGLAHSSRLHRDDWGTTEAGTAQAREPQCICPPFLAPFVWDCRWPLDLAPMQDAAARLVGEHDFASFAASDPDRSTRDSPETEPFSTVRTVYTSTLSRTQESIIYRITGNGFLHHMVRNIVGTLAEVGRGALAPDDIDPILASRDRSQAGPTAPASGLFLVSVDYTAEQA